ncbi:MAG: hypothetical protein JEZ14_23175 [Marinilabiliaceae bacterium]|nr:hypothetical protein [Marinilabiliaceae bacterium]
MRIIILVFIIQLVISAGFSQTKASNLLYSTAIMGDTVNEDQFENKIKSISKDIFRDIVMKNGSGQTITTIEEDIFGNHIVKDSNGHVIARLEKDIFGDIIIKNGNGEIIAEYGAESLHVSDKNYAAKLCIIEQFINNMKE